MTIECPMNVSGMFKNVPEYIMNVTWLSRLARLARLARLVRLG